MKVDEKAGRGRDIKRARGAPGERVGFGWLGERRGSQLCILNPGRCSLRGPGCTPQDQ